MANEGFRQVNQDQHDRFSAAFQKLEKYCRYLSSDGTRSIDVGAIDSPRRVKTSSVSQSNSALNELAESLYTFLKESSDGISKDDILAHFNNYSTKQVNRALVECHTDKEHKN